MSGYFYIVRCALGLLIFLFLNAGESQAAPQARILNEKGRLVTIVPTLWLDRQHLAVPATVFRHFGLDVFYDQSERRLYIFIPESCAMVGMRAGSRRHYHPDVGYLPEISAYPLSQKRNGHFFVSVWFIEQNFEQFSVSWDAKKKQLTLRRKS